MELPDAGRALLLVVTAHSVPWALGRLLRGNWDYPVDGGRCFLDGRRLLGAHKTWRGIVGALLACGVAGHLLGPGIAVGLSFGALAMLGDLASSFVKRRLNMKPGREVPAIDQLPEALLPLIVLAPTLSLNAIEIVLVAVLFSLLDLLLARLRH